MKKLSLVLLCALSIHAFSQTTANTPPNLTQCNNEVFDLTVQTPIILGEQPDSQFTVTYFETLADAMANTNAIGNPTAYVGQMQQMIYARVDNTADFTSDITSFAILWDTLVIGDYPDVTVCESYTLPSTFPNVNYYTAPGGTGLMLPAGTVITNTMTVYVHGTNGVCVDGSSFEVIVYGVQYNVFPDVTACETYVLPDLDPGMTYWTGTQGTGTMLQPGQPVTVSTNIYVLSQGFCTSESVFHINIGNPPLVPQSPLLGCDPDGDGFAVYDIASRIPNIIDNVANLSVNFYETMAEAQNEVNPVSNLSSYNAIVSGSSTIYYRVNDLSGDCFSVGQLELQPVQCGSIMGVVRFDADENGCTPTDETLANVQIAATYNNTTVFAYTNGQGEYAFTNLIPVGYMMHVNSYAGNVTPSWQQATVSANGVTTVDFCVTPIQPINDVMLYLWPLTQARPGFPAHYQMQLYNVGTSAQNGTVNLNFDDTKLNFVQSIPSPTVETGGQLQFDFSNLLPGQIRNYNIAFNVESPPTVSGGMVLLFDGAAITDLLDVTPANNNTTLAQTVVNSFDPNDKTVLQEAVLNTDTQTTLKYIVRFQNTGTADAVNIKITDQLDENLNWNTFRPVAASHAYNAQMNQDGLVTFTFNNINLPDSTSNEPASHGFVAYEVKLKPSLTVDDDIYNTANIYFDFNAPIVTNTVMTDLVGMLGLGEQNVSLFAMYPNPANSAVTIKANGAFTARIFDLQGKTVVEDRGENSASLNVTMLQSGMYFVKVTTGNASEVKKLMVK